MEMILATGYWCPPCEVFEFDTEVSYGESCSACGCLVGDHIKCKVLSIPTEKEVVNV